MVNVTAGTGGRGEGSQSLNGMPIVGVTRRRMGASGEVKGGSSDQIIVVVDLGMAGKEYLPRTRRCTWVQGIWVVCDGGGSVGLIILI